MRRYQLHLTASGVGVPTLNQTVSTLRFFFKVTLRRHDIVEHTHFIHEARKLPVVLSPEEVARLLDPAPGLKYKAALSVAYGAGLRAAEVVSLKVSDIDSKCERLGDREHLFFVLRGLWNCVFDRANLEQSLEIANTLFDRAKGGSDLEQLGLAYRAVGATRFNRGEFCELLEAFRKVIEACGSLDNDNAVKAYGEAPAIISLVYSGWTLCIQGRLEEGVENGERHSNWHANAGIRWLLLSSANSIPIFWPSIADRPPVSRWPRRR